MKRPVFIALAAMWLGAVFSVSWPAPSHGQSDALAESQRLSRQAIQLHTQGRYAEAEAAMKRALEISKKLLGPAHASVGTLENNLAMIYVAQGRYAEAEPLYLHALENQERGWGEDNPRVASTLNNLAELYRNQGRYAEAEPLYERAIAIQERVLPPDHPDLGESLGSLAKLYQNQGRLAEAERLYERALEIMETARPSDNRLPATMENLAMLYQVQGRHADAESLHRRALEILEQASGANHPEVGLTLNNLAAIYAVQNRSAEAEPLYKRALEIMEKALGPEHPRLAAPLSSLGELYRRQGRYAEAEPLFERALEIMEKTLGPGHPDAAIVLHNLALLYREQGRYDEAQEGLELALEIMEEALGRDHPNVALPLNALAELNQARDRLTEAEPLYERAVAIMEKALGPEHPGTAVAVSNLVDLYRDQGRAEDAYALSKKSIVALLRRAVTLARGETTSGDTERRSMRALFVGHLLAAAAAAEKMPARKPEIAAAAFPAGQAALLSPADRAASQAALRFAAGLPALGETVRGRQDAVAQRNTLDMALVAAVGKPPAERNAVDEQRTRDEIATLGAKIADYDERLARDFPEFSQLANPTPLALDETRKLLAPDEALLVFVADDDGVFRWVVRRDRADFAQVEIEKADLEKTVAALRASLDITAARTIADLLLFEAAKAHELYDKLIAPVEAMLAGATRLLIVPDGPLSGLPFSLLITTKPPARYEGFNDYRRTDWLVRRYAITTLPSVGSLRALRVLAKRGAPAREPFVGFGDPLLEGGPGSLSVKGVGALVARGLVADVNAVRQLPPLQEAADELERLAKSLRASVTNVFVRSQATERRVKQMDLSRFRVLAFSTHGLMAGEFKGYGEPALVLTPPEKGDQIDDGLLGASEIAQLKLNADWVVLSACNTAAPDGTPGAEGLSGLARAFFYAGSRALLVSHWKVLSEASVQLTTGTFDALAKAPAIGRAEALRRSMLALLDDVSLPPHYAHPAVWAPFSLVGEGGAGR